MNLFFLRHILKYHHRVYLQKVYQCSHNSNCKRDSSSVKNSYKKISSKGITSEIIGLIKDFLQRLYFRIIYKYLKFFNIWIFFRVSGILKIQNNFISVDFIFFFKFGISSFDGRIISNNSPFSETEISLYSEWT